MLTSNKYKRCIPRMHTACKKRTTSLCRKNKSK
ncbi:hypothetical protein LINPERPRIM_LOCUS18966 [Linum perenne]